ncbi:hypothetical protein [Blastococcus sp. TF02A-30]|uniref:hypothetical protein n=1 Tax=Blastococcus sp. TF02A-30 TaxID=2250580 RepID=UPI000DE92CE1|nr:hypothetical protein [Blastococcus sp. TF02A-30]RBY86584.1 hypothetical protein DQ241_13865 [Blastococcus sp. TF02A-30]
MLPHHPRKKLRHLLHRFAAVEGQVAQLHQRLDTLGAALAAAHDTVNRSLDEIHARGHRGEAVTDQRFTELRDSVHLAARRGTLQRPRTRALFLVHHIEAWDGCHGLVEAMRAAEDFEPIVATIPRRFPGASRFEQEEEVHRGLDARGVPHLRLTAHEHDEALRLIKAIDPDLVVRQAQWDADIPADLATDRLTFARLCLLPYETMNLVQNVPDERGANSAVDSAYHRAAWVVFCANERMAAMARRDGARAGTQFRVTGHPKADRLRSAAPFWPIASWESAPGRRIVWSAHHSIGRGWSDFGTFPLIADDMLAWAASQPEVQFVFMPHPALLTFPSSTHSPVSREEFDGWLERWQQLPNTALFTDGDYAPLLAASDVLITDGLSMLIEYQVLGKPLVFVEREGHRPFNEIGEQALTGVHTAGSVPEAQALARRFLAGHADPLRERQAANVADLFGPAGSAERILSSLRELIAEERARDGAAC